MRDFSAKNRKADAGWKKKLRFGGKEIEREKERADKLTNTLEAICEVIVREANELYVEQGNTLSSGIFLLQHRDAEPQQLVHAVFAELHRSARKNQELERNVKRLELDVSRLGFRDNDRTHLGYQGRADGLRENHYANENQGIEYTSGLENDISLLQYDKSELENKVRVINYENEKRKKELLASHAEINKLHEALDARKGKLQEAYHTKENLQRVHDADKRELEDRLQEAYAVQESLQRAHTTEMERLQEDHNAEIRLLRSEYETKKQQASQKHESNLARLHGEMREMKETHNLEQEQMRNDFYSEKSELERRKTEEGTRLKSEFKTKEAQLETAHTAEKKRLRRDIEAYSGFLLARDEFTPMSDNEIKGRFVELAQEIDALARLEWNPNQKAWTNQVLQQLSENQRLLRKRILQDSVWVTLHENIFCSPFRVLGEEGRSLESQWISEYGNDSQPDNRSYIWPEPSIDAERWRYACIKECRAALEKPASKWDPRAKLKKSFITSLDALKNELISALGEVCDLDRSSVQTAENIIKKAAKMWLEFGTQRCRILVVVRGSNLKSAEEKIQRAEEGTLELVVAPELKRFGDSKGQDMHIEETVGKCDGEMAEVSIAQ